MKVYRDGSPLFSRFRSDAFLGETAKVVVTNARTSLSFRYRGMLHIAISNRVTPADRVDLAIRSAVAGCIQEQRDSGGEF